MLNVNPYSLGGALVGGLLGIYLFSVLFRYALLGRGGTKTQHLWVIMLTGVVAVGFSAFGAGTDGFVNRITHPPDMARAIAYALSALVVAFFAWRKIPEEQPPVERPKRSGIVGRAVALVFVIPMILIGVGNLAGTAYSIAVNGLPPGSGLRATHTEIRQIMLDGDMAVFWAMVDEKAPEDLDFIIQRLLVAEDNYRSADDVLAKLNIEVLNYRVSLAIYGPALTDVQRQAIIRSQTDFIRAFQSDPEACVVVATTGGAGLSQAQLLSMKSLFNRTMTEMMGLLIDARAAATEGAMMPAAPTEDDYLGLINSIYKSGFTEDQLMAFLNEDTAHPGYCAMTIGYMDAVAGFEGPAGERIRFETTQILLTTRSL